jgi:peptide/nickel transport system substrate-binding protein
MRLPKARAQSRPNLWVLLLSFWVAPIFGAGAPAAQGDVNTEVTGGSLIYLEARAHTNLYPPAGGFYPNGGIFNQIADQLTCQNPKTLKIEPWVAESWEINRHLGALER